MMKFDKNLTSVGTSLLVLHLLSGADMYGYQIITELARRSDDTFTFQEGTLYPVLHSLEKSGLLETYAVTADTGRRRKYYRITARGEKQLAQKKREWAQFSSAMNQMLEVRG